MKFWTKAERVVTYKNKSVADARKKEVMDKHLNYLVGQTQRYSSMLAQRLHAGTVYSCSFAPCKLSLLTFWGLLLSPGGLLHLYCSLDL